MAVTVQKGTSLKIGFATTWTNYIQQSMARSATGEQDVIKDEDNATTTVLVSDLGERIKVDAIVKSTGSLTPPAKGSTFAYGGVNYRVEDTEVTEVAGAAKVTVTAIKEASMTYT